MHRFSNYSYFTCMATITLRLSEKSDKETSQKAILIRFRHGKIDQYANMNIYVSSEYWNNEQQTIIIPNWRVLSAEKKKIQKDLQGKLDKLNKLKLHIQSTFQGSNKQVVAKDWLKKTIDEFNFPKIEEKTSAAVKTILQAFSKLIDSANNGSRTVRKTQKPVDGRTVVQYRQTQKVLKAYLKAQKSKDIDLADVNEDFYRSFVNYLYGQGYKLNTVGKHIKNIKAAINALPMSQRITCEFIEPRKCPRLSEEVDNIYLNEEELETIATMQINASYLDRVRDQFILLAWTGCRYSDLPKLKKENIHPMSNGGQCFRLEQRKTSTKVIIPIFPAVEAILKKYNYNVPKPISSQSFNRFIKEVAKLANLVDDAEITHTEKGNDKKVGRVTMHYKKWECVVTHTGRRSFATNMYKRNFPTLMIMRITGHKTEKAFLSYIKVTEEENAERMLELFLNSLASPKPLKP